MKYFQSNTLTEFFDYTRTLSAAEYTVLAGGTDLVPRYENGKTLPQHLINIKHIPGLQGIVEHDDSVEIGALTTVESLKMSAVITRLFPALSMAAREFAGLQIRNRATIGGNICNASPAGDLLPGLYAFAAELKIAGADSERIIPLKDFITAPGKTVLKKGEILKSVILPKSGFDSYFYKLGLRSSMAISVVNFALVYKFDQGRFDHLKIAAGSVAPAVVMLDRFARQVRENIPDLRDAAALIDDDISPISDLRATADYRRTVLKNLLIHKLESLTGVNLER